MKTAATITTLEKIERDLVTVTKSERICQETRRGQEGDYGDPDGVAQEKDRVSQSATLNSHPVIMVAGFATLTELEKNPSKTCSTLNQLERKLREA